MVPNRFVVCRLGKDTSLVTPRPYHLGDVELRSAKLDAPSEKSAIEESAASFGESVELSIAPRLVTIVDAPNQRQALELADSKFEEALDALTIGSQLVMSDLALLPCGYIRALSDAVVHPILNRRAPGPVPATAFRIVDEKYPLLEFSEALFAVGRTELVDRLLRSAHWARKARWEANRQLRTLHRWFAMEAAWKRPDKDDDVVPIAMLALGFPIGQYSAGVSDKILTALQGHPRYRNWRDQVLKRLNRLRDWRNDSVHSGFRPWDVSRKELDELDHISVLACGRVQGLLQRAVVAGIVDIDIAREYAPLLFQEDPNVVQNVHGIIIFNLENPRS